MARGIEGRDIFGTDDDRTAFLSLMSSNLLRVGYKCYAWALMTNHYHLVLRASDRHLAELMRPLNADYARTYGERHGRRGYLFQDRYKSVVTQDQRYVEELIRYVHLNPLRAGICRDIGALDRYPWTGHSALMGSVTRDFQDTAAVLRRFGQSTEEGRAAYRRFVGDGDGTDATVDAVRVVNRGTQSATKPATWVIGDRDFVKHAIETDRCRRITVKKWAATGQTLDDLRGAVAQSYGLDREALLHRSRLSEVADARKVLAYVGHRELGFTVAEIGRYLSISGPAVSQMLRDGGRLAKDRRILFL
jgi:REP element-mobilizing transposase RayT